MKYKVEYLPQVIKTLEKMDKYTKRILLEWIEKNLVDCEDPRMEAKNDQIGNSLMNDPEYFAHTAVVDKNRDFKANIGLHSRGNNPDAFQAWHDLQQSLQERGGTDQQPERRHQEVDLGEKGERV